MDGSGAPRFKLLLVLAALAALTCGTAAAADFTVINNCSYTIYPGIYPADYANGGWQMNPGTQVSFTLNSGFIGRIWGRIGCNGANPAVCSTGQCGGEGLQCAGTTGVAGSSGMPLPSAPPISTSAPGNWV